jgi:hypothetical protein
MVDGSIPTVGAYFTIAGRSNLDMLKEAATGAAAIIAVGTCSAYGGLPKAKPNPTQAMSVSDVIKNKPIINVSGCPPIPIAITGVIAHYLTLGTLPELDPRGRPLAFCGENIHDRCYRRPFYDRGMFAETFDDEGARRGWCLYKLGCKAPVTYNSCALVKWNQGVSFPIQSGHAYPALRWNPMLSSGGLPFDMVYMSEYLGRMARAGRLRLRPLEGKVTYHDPCKTGRRGGAFEEPRAVFKAMNADYLELPANKEYNWCCGGGARIFLLEPATRLRDESFKIKLQQVNATGAGTVVVSCASCRLNFEAGRVKNRWDKQVASLVELVADHLIDDMPQPPATAGADSERQEVRS